MRRAFTLAEVLVAVAIVSIAGIAMLKMNGANLFFFTKLKNYAQIQDVLGIAGLHGSVTFNRDDKTLYHLLEPSYAINNDDLREYLKSQTYRYDETLVDTISFDTDTVAQETDTGDVQLNEVASSASPQIQFELIKIVLSNKQNHGSILQIRPTAQ